VYTRSTADGSNWTNWERNGNSLDAPELEVLKDRLYQTVLGGDKGVYTRSTADGSNWTSWERSGNALNAPELEEFKGRLYQTVRGGDEGVYTRSTADGINWTSWDRNGNGLDAPELEVFNDRLYQTIRGGDQGTYTRSTFDGINWTSWERSGVGLSSSNFTVFNNRFFQHVEGIDSKIYVRSLGNSSNATWSNWQEFGGWTFREGGSPLLTVQGAQYFRDRPQFYMQQGNPFAKGGLGSTVLGHNNWGKEGNCTWYAYGRLKELGFTPEDILLPPGQQNANQWGGTLKNGARILKPNETPQVGDVAQFLGGKFGHVAIVEKVENGRVFLSESNYETDKDGDKDGNRYTAGTLHWIENYTVGTISRYIRLAKR
jgi:surface antigen